MTRLPRVTGREVIATLRKAGFEVVRIKGSHHFLRHPDGRGTVVPHEQDREVLEGAIVKVSYDVRVDIITVVLRDDVPVAESDEDDYDDKGNLVAVEILDASKRVTDARRVEFQMTE